MRFAFDVGGVITKYPEVCRGMINALVADFPRTEVFVVTDIHDRPELLDMLERNCICPPVPEANVLISDYDRYGEACKAILLREHGISVLIDDHGGYLVWPWPEPAPMRLMVQPDPRRPYHAASWRAVGNLGGFGRQAYLDD